MVSLPVSGEPICADAQLTSFAMVSIYQFPAWMVPPVPTEAEHELFNALNSFTAWRAGAVAALGWLLAMVLPFGGACLVPAFGAYLVPTSPAVSPVSGRSLAASLRRLGARS
jgi:hypothetical protein